MFDTNLAAHLAELSKLNFTESELKKITEEMDSIVSLMDTVSDFEGADTMGANQPVGLENIRADEIKDSMPRKDVLKNASKKTDACFTVPKVV